MVMILSSADTTLRTVATTRPACETEASAVLGSIGSQLMVLAIADPTMGYSTLS